MSHQCDPHGRKANVSIVSGSECCGWGDTNSSTSATCMPHTWRRLYTKTGSASENSNEAKDEIKGAALSHEES